MSVSLGVLLNNEEIRPGHSWINIDDGELNTSLRVGSLGDSISIQGTPEDMDRLAEAACTGHGPPSRSCARRPERGPASDLHRVDEQGVEPDNRL